VAGRSARLPTTAGFEDAAQFVRPEDVAGSIPCGPDLDAIVEAVTDYWEAGFTDIALVQLGDDGQDLFLKEAAVDGSKTLAGSNPAAAKKSCWSSGRTSHDRERTDTVRVMPAGPVLVQGRCASRWPTAAWWSPIGPWSRSDECPACEQSITRVVSRSSM
jgi:hypothetical protein